MHASEPQSPHWIAIQEQLPDTAERVLLYTPYTVLGDDHTVVGNRESITTCTTRVNCRQVPVFTHWMPLPPTPQ